MRYLWLFSRLFVGALALGVFLVHLSPSGFSGGRW